MKHKFKIGDRVKNKLNNTNIYTVSKVFWTQIYSWSDLKYDMVMLNECSAAYRSDTFILINRKDFIARNPTNLPYIETMYLNKKESV